VTTARPLFRIALAAALLATAGGARAEAPEPLPARVSNRSGRLEVSIDLSGAFPPALERQLGNGLTNVVAIWVTIVPAGGGGPVALHGRIVELLFDVWDETYAVTVKDPRSPRGGRLVLKDFAALRELLAEERGLDLGPLVVVPVGGFYVDARVELNPVSKEQLQRTREYIANPAAGARPGGGGSRSVLGAVASFLLREPDRGSDVHLFRSRVFTAGEVAAR
jgi:hypothetical protein